MKARPEEVVCFEGQDFAYLFFGDEGACARGINTLKVYILDKV